MWSWTTFLLLDEVASFFGGDIERFSTWDVDLFDLAGDICRLAGENYFLAGDFVAERIGD